VFDVMPMQTLAQRPGFRASPPLAELNDRAGITRPLKARVAAM
jgi:hypothetical protein